MNPVRSIPIDTLAQLSICACCAESPRNWDRLAGQPYCPHCLEALVIGEAKPLRLQTENASCAVCSECATIPFLTFPLNHNQAIEIDLCGHHLRALLGRRLGPNAFDKLRRWMKFAGVDVGQVFLLHEAFYDAYGRALQPAELV